MALLKIMTNGQRKIQIQDQKFGLTNDSRSMAGFLLFFFGQYLRITLPFQVSP
jgi:hypothetical protein